MSLRKIAKELGVSPTLLSLVLSGQKRSAPLLEKLGAHGYNVHGVGEQVNTRGKHSYPTGMPQPTAHLSGAVSSGRQSTGLLIRVSWVRIPHGPPNLTIDRTIFEMWLSLAGTPIHVAARS